MTIYVIADQEITLAVVTQLINDPGVAAHLVDVTTNAGVATLSRCVDNLLAKERATAVTGAVKGVQAVINRINVNPRSWPDESLKKDIELTFLRDAAVDSYDIDVDVTDGIARLAGTAKGWLEFNAAKINAYDGGAKKVVNALRLGLIERPF